MLANILKAIVLGFSKTRLPKMEGELKLGGLESPVKVVRDKDGIPHIYAQNLKDLAFGQGVVQAQDRLFQMELNRRLATGRLAEIVGKDAISTDKAVRTFGFHRIAQKDEELMDDEVRELLNSYLNGLNTFITSKVQKLPVEFGLMRIKPEPWTVNDILSFSRLMSWQMSFAWQGELAKAKLVEKVGPELAAEINPQYPVGNPIGLPNGNEMNQLDVSGAFEAINGPYLRQVGGSNAWAVSGEHTDTGKPFLCNDPHLPMLLPSIWHEVHLHTPDFEVAGVSIPCSPLVLIGHNRNIAWGITLAYTDIQDIFVEEFISDSTYRFGNEERNATIHREVIHVKGGDAIEVDVVETHHGPIISDVANFPERRVALASSCFKPGQLMRGWLNLNQAKGWNDFVDAMKCFTSPALNIVYADVDENIGYWVTGEVPVRSKPKSMTPYNGFSGEEEWNGVVPFEEMPHCLNPESGKIVSCNHKVVTEDYPHFLGNTWMNGYRAKRVEQLLTERHKFSLKEMGRIQMDLFCTPGVELQAHYTRISGLNEQENHALGSFRAWNGHLTVDSIGGTVYQVLRTSLVSILLEKTLGEGLLQDMTGKPFHELLAGITEMYGHDTTMLLRLLDDENSMLVKNAGGKEQLLQDALTHTANSLFEEFGNNPDKWEWGLVHQILFEHPIGKKKPFDQVFNIGPHRIGGDTDTVHQTAFFKERGYDGTLVCPSYRQLIDLGDLNRSLNMFAPGNSGQVGSPFYSNLLKPWRKGQFKKMRWGKVKGGNLIIS